MRRACSATNVRALHVTPRCTANIASAPECTVAAWDAGRIHATRGGVGTRVICGTYLTGRSYLNPICNAREQGPTVRILYHAEALGGEGDDSPGPERAIKGPFGGGINVSQT